MNKTFTINLANQIFNINDDAYETLLAYFSSLEKFYANEEGKEDIITDIKARFAELFFEKGKNYIITKEDAEQVINTMGKPQEFDEEKVEQEQQTTQNYSSTSTKTGDAGKSGKRLYRDTDEPIVAGVASGLSAYFGIDDPIWIRIAFIVLAIIGFGSPVLIYVILWIIMPEAQTSAQKLEMKGEAINLSNIEKTIKDETDKMQQNLRNNKGALAQIISFLGMLIKLFFKFLLGVGIFVIIVVLFSLLIALLATTFGAGIALLFGTPIASKYFFDSNSFTWMISLGGILVSIIPFILLITGIVHVVSKKSKPFKKQLVLPLFGLFMFGLMLLNISYNKGKALIQEHKKITQHVPINYSTNLDTIQLAMAYTDKSEEDLNFSFNSLGSFLKFVSNDHQLRIPVEIEIYPSNSDSITILKEFSAQGKDEKEALINATSITQSISQINNKFIIDPFIEFNTAKSKFRNQKLKIKVFVPEGKVIKWNETVEKYMDEDKLPFNWTAGRYISKKETKQQQQLELKIKSLTDSTTINLNIDSNNPDVQSALEDAKIELENAKEELMDAKEELNDELDTAMDDFYSHEHYIFKMVNGELVPLD
ncbi:MAG: PspC domain-containing protein [Chitinophagales bacterium]|nr:PspC domain-containing protein [Saprospirales bacterium]MBP6659843.1 PspC domain-containing protein [Chitinophagales bacterium]